MADRLAWTDGQLTVGEAMITSQNNVSIYDGSEKVRKTENLFELFLSSLDGLSKRDAHLN